MKPQTILDVLSDCDIVIDIKIIDLVQEPGRQSLRAVAQLHGGYILHINEAHGRSFRSYSYHVRKGDEMVQRWDNAPHWPGMKTFPNHLHLGSEKNVIECREVFVTDVLREIKKYVK